MAIAPFRMDGKEYDVAVIALTRSFSIQDREGAGRTQDGNMWRDIIGTFYNYEMTVAPRYDNQAAMDEFWEAVSKPVEYHVCTFPYNQKTLTQKMYVAEGTQDISLLTEDKTKWASIQLKYVAMSPKVVP